jgi:D-arabinitol 4-dehydrogenase
MDPSQAHAICAASDPVHAFCHNTVLWGDIAGHPDLLSAVRRGLLRVQAFVAHHSPAAKV